MNGSSTMMNCKGPNRWTMALPSRTISTRGTPPRPLPHLLRAFYTHDRTRGAFGKPSSSNERPFDGRSFGRTARQLRLWRVSARPGSGHPTSAGRPFGRGGVSHRRRQVAVLPIARAAAAGRDAGRLAADRPDEGSDRRPRRARHRRSPARFHAHPGRAPRGHATGAGRRAAAACTWRPNDFRTSVSAKRCGTSTCRCSRSTRPTASRNGGTTFGPTI